jgi:hypothetical protein
MFLGLCIDHQLIHAVSDIDQNPDPRDEGKIKRMQRTRAKEEDHSRYCQLGIHQGYIEQGFLDLLASEGRIQVERNVRTKSLQLDDARMHDHSAYALKLNIGRGSSLMNGNETAHECTESQTVCCMLFR